MLFQNTLLLFRKPFELPFELNLRVKNNTNEALKNNRKSFVGVFFAVLLVGPFSRPFPVLFWGLKKKGGKRRPAGAPSARLRSLNPPLLFSTFPANGRGVFSESASKCRSTK